MKRGRLKCACCGVGCTIPDEGYRFDGLVLHRWCASSIAISIIKVLRRELGLFKKGARPQA